MESFFSRRDAGMDKVIFSFKIIDVHQRAEQQIGISDLVHPDLSGHLTRNDLNMLVVDIYRL